MGHLFSPESFFTTVNAESCETTLSRADQSRLAETRAVCSSRPEHGHGHATSRRACRPGPGVRARAARGETHERPGHIKKTLKNVRAQLYLSRFFWKTSFSVLLRVCQPAPLISSSSRPSRFMASAHGSNRDIPSSSSSSSAAAAPRRTRLPSSPPAPPLPPPTASASRSAA